MAATPIADPVTSANPAPSPNTTTAEADPGFFQEDNGTYSSIRLMSFVVLLAAIVFGFLSITFAADGKQDGGNGIYITFGFLISAFAPKVVQKFAEQKIPQMGTKQ